MDPEINNSPRKDVTSTTPADQAQERSAHKQSSDVAAQSQAQAGANVDLAGATISRELLLQTSRHDAAVAPPQVEQSGIGEASDRSRAGHGFAALTGMCLAVPFFPVFMASGVSQLAAFVSAGAAWYMSRGISNEKQSSMVAAVYGGFVGASGVIHYVANQESWLSNLSLFNFACAVGAGAAIVAKLAEKWQASKEA